MKLAFCRFGHPGRPKGSQCRECKLAARRRENARRRLGADAPTTTAGAPERLAPGPELERLRKKHQPTATEWEAVQVAAGRIRDFLETKGAFQSGHKRFDGPTAWDVLEAATGNDQKRFHQLSSLATLQHEVWEGVRHGRIMGPGRRLPPETVRRIRKLHAAGETNTTIAYMTGLGLSTVSKVLAGETHRDSEAA